MLHQPKAPEWVQAADLGRDKDMNHPFLSRQALVTPVTTFINLVLDPLGNSRLYFGLPWLSYETR